jgi:hypothetical protein
LLITLGPAARPALRRQLEIVYQGIDLKYAKSEEIARDDTFLFRDGRMLHVVESIIWTSIINYRHSSRWTTCILPPSIRSLLKYPCPKKNGPLKGDQEKTNTKKNPPQKMDYAVRPDAR